jgi:hypothetical protein
MDRFQWIKIGFQLIGLVISGNWFGYSLDMEIELGWFCIGFIY